VSAAADMDASIVQAEARLYTPSSTVVDPRLRMLDVSRRSKRLMRQRFGRRKHLVVHLDGVNVPQEDRRMDKGLINDASISGVRLPSIDLPKRSRSQDHSWSTAGVVTSIHNDAKPSDIL
jgi:hypothetical protein